MWQNAVRIQPWRHPEVTIWDELVGADDLPGLFAILTVVEPETARKLGAVERLDMFEPMPGSGAGWAMPAFTLGGPGRFNPANVGCFYASHERKTAIAETVYHQQRFLQGTDEPPLELRMRALHADIQAPNAVDLLTRAVPGKVLDPDDYTESRIFGASAHASGCDGVAYPSVRRGGGQCIAIFRPAVIQRCSHAVDLVYLWDGRRIERVESRARIEW